MKGKTMKKLLNLFCAVVMLAACSSQDASFKGKEYKLTNAPENAEITLGFDKTENRFFGHVVNNYFGTYEVKGTALKFGPAGVTMMAGPENLMKAESQYLMMLPKVNAFVLEENKLTLKTTDGQELVYEEMNKKEES